MGICDILAWDYSLSTPLWPSLIGMEILPARSRAERLQLEGGSVLRSGGWCPVASFSEVQGRANGSARIAGACSTIWGKRSWLRLHISTGKTWEGPRYSHTFDWPWSCIHAPRRLERALWKDKPGANLKKDWTSNELPLPTHISIGRGGSLSGSRCLR